MEKAGAGGRPKAIDMWEHVMVLEGKKKVKCKHCGFEFAASANRIKSHIHQIKGQGIRLCTQFPQLNDTASNEEKQDLLDSHGSSILDRPREYDKLDETMLDCYMSPKTMWDGIKSIQQVQTNTEAMHQERIKVGPFYVSSIVNDSDLRLIQHSFEHSSDRCILFSLSRSFLCQSQLTTIRPQTHLDSWVIDIFADILTDIERRKKSEHLNWYLPVMFSTAALNSGDESSFIDFVQRNNMRDNYMSDLVYCEKIFIPVRVGKNSSGHYYLYIIHMKNQEVEIWDSLCEQFIDKTKRDQITEKLLLAMEKLFVDVMFTKFHRKMASNILLQPNGYDSGIFIINYMQQSDNYVRINPSFQFDSHKERLDLVLKLLKSDLNKEKDKLYDEAGKSSAKVQGYQDLDSGHFKRKQCKTMFEDVGRGAYMKSDDDSDDGDRRNNVALITESPISVNASPFRDDINGDHPELKPDSKKRKMIPRWIDQVMSSSETTLDEPQDDGFCWRKYGQIEFLGAKYTSYYRCNFRMTQNCWATKKIERSDEDPSVFEITYQGRHTCSLGNNDVQPPKSPDQQQENIHNYDLDADDLDNEGMAKSSAKVQGYQDLDSGHFKRKQCKTMFEDVGRGAYMKSDDSDDGDRRNNFALITESPISVNASPFRDDIDGDHPELKPDSKKRKMIPRWIDQVMSSSETTLDEPQDDGFCWRKYGQKEFLGGKYTRSYYRCNFRMTQNCWATKKIERSDEDPSDFEITYQGRHTCSLGNNDVQPPKSPDQQQEKIHNYDLDADDLDNEGMAKSSAKVQGYQDLDSGHFKRKQCKTMFEDVGRGAYMKSADSDDGDRRNNFALITESPISVNASPFRDDIDGDHPELKPDSKKRKMIPRWIDQVMSSSETTLDEPQDDGFCWRKYGQKEFLGGKYTRSYYRCNFRMTQNCWATKKIERSDEDPSVFEITYRGRHTCSLGNNDVQPPKSPDQQQEKIHNYDLDADDLDNAGMAKSSAKVQGYQDLDSGHLKQCKTMFEDVGSGAYMKSADSDDGDRRNNVALITETTWEEIKALQQVQTNTEAMHQDKIKVGPFNVYNIVNERDSKLIQYVFEQSSDRCKPFSLSHSFLGQSEFTTLGPETHLDSLVIDIFADILTDIEKRKESKPFNWYLPEMFSRAAINSYSSVNFVNFVEKQKMRENYMFGDLKYCEKIFIPVHVEKNSCGHYYLYIIHMKNQEVEIWDSLCHSFLAETERDEKTQKLLCAMENLLGKVIMFTKFGSRMATDILLQPNKYDCGIFVINYMQQSDNYVRQNPLFQFDSDKERLDLALKLLKNDLNGEKKKLYDKAARSYSEVQSEEALDSCSIKRKRLDTSKKISEDVVGRGAYMEFDDSDDRVEKRKNVGVKTGSLIVDKSGDYNKPHEAMLDWYINDLKKELELSTSKDSRAPPPDKEQKTSNNQVNGKLLDLDIQVKIMGWGAMIHIQCSRRNHPAARLMAALQELGLEVNHATVSVVNDLMILQATVKMVHRYCTQEQLRVALSCKLGDVR